MSDTTEATKPKLKAVPEVVKIAKQLIGKTITMHSGETDEAVRTFVISRVKECVNRPCFIINNVWVFTQEEALEILMGSEAPE